ncbi:hypothetical protein D3C78_1720770 [compost metagenome]
MQLMRATRLPRHLKQPLPSRARVGGKVQHHRHPRPHQGRHMAAHGVAQPRGATRVVRDALDLAGIQRRQPMVFADQQRAGLRGKRRGQCGLARGDLAAQKVQGAG